MSDNQITSRVVLGSGERTHIFTFVAPFELDKNKLLRRFFGHYDMHILTKLYYFQPSKMNHLEIVFVADGSELPKVYVLAPEFRVVLMVNTKLLQPTPDNLKTQTTLEDCIARNIEIAEQLKQQEDYFLGVLGDLEEQLNRIAPREHIVSLCQKLQGS